MSTTCEPITFGAQSGFAVGNKGAPAVIVVPEWWGVNEEVREHAEKIANTAGYRVLVPDLYKGKEATTKEEAQQHMQALDLNAAVAEISEGADHLLAEGSPKVGIVGFCMGGSLAWMSAEKVKSLSCAIPCYGIPDAAYDPDLSIPVQAHHGEQDSMTGFSDMATAKALEARLVAKGADTEFHYYPDVGHGFLNTSPDPYTTWEERQEKMGFVENHEGATAKAWSNIFEFLNKNLKE